MNGKTKPKKRPSGHQQLKAQGKTIVNLGLSAKQIDVIDRAASADGRSRANFISHYAAETARRILGDAAPYRSDSAENLDKQRQ